jgi:hypothetical protein
LSLTGIANAGGSDTVILNTGAGQPPSASNGDSILDLANFLAGESSSSLSATVVVP